MHYTLARHLLISLGCLPMLDNGIIKAKLIEAIGLPRPIAEYPRWIAEYHELWVKGEPEFTYTDWQFLLNYVRHLYDL